MDWRDDEESCTSVTGDVSVPDTHTTDRRGLHTYRERERRTFRNVY